MAGLIGHSLLEVAARAFYAQQKAIAPLITSGLTALAFILLGLFFTPLLGAPGIGLANTLAFTAEMLFLFWLIGRKHPGWFKLDKPFLRIALASTCSGLLAYFLISFIPWENLSSVMSALVGGAALGVSGMVVIPFIWPEVKLLGKI